MLSLMQEVVELQVQLARLNAKLGPRHRQEGPREGHQHQGSAHCACALDFFSGKSSKRTKPSRYGALKLRAHAHRVLDTVRRELEKDINITVWCSAECSCATGSGHRQEGPIEKDINIKEVLI